jgi:hypothetical protein
MQDLSIKNAAKEGISLGKPTVQFVYINMLQRFRDTHLFLRISAVNLGCLSRIQIIFHPRAGSRIPDPTATKKRREKN